MDEARKCTLELIDPVRQRGGRRSRPNAIALEIDLTTPLAYMWSRTDLERYRWSGLLRPEQGLAAGQSADDPPLRAGQDSRGHGSWVDFHPAGLDPHAQ